MADIYTTTGDELTAVADAIRAKSGTSEPLPYPDGFVSAIGDISGGGGGSVTPFSEILTGTVELSGSSWTLPKSDNLLGGYLICLDKWGVKDNLPNKYVQMAVFATKQSFGYFSQASCPVVSSAVGCKNDVETVDTGCITVTDGILSTEGVGTRYFGGNYWYALIYGSK